MPQYYSWLISLKQAFLGDSQPGFDFLIDEHFLSRILHARVFFENFRQFFVFNRIPNTF
jgi:hypothetical protein